MSWKRRSYYYDNLWPLLHVLPETLSIFEQIFLITGWDPLQYWNKDNMQEKYMNFQMLIQALRLFHYDMLLYLWKKKSVGWEFGNLFQWRKLFIDWIKMEQKTKTCYESMLVFTFVSADICWSTILFVPFNCARISQRRANFDRS